MEGVEAEPAVVVVAAAQEPAVALGVGQSPKKQAMSLVASSHASTRPLVRLPQPAVMSETTMPGTRARSDTMEPSSMSSKTLTASVTAASAAPRISVGRDMAILMASLTFPMTSSGRSWMISGTWPCSSWVMKSRAASASFSRVLMVSQGIWATSWTKLRERRSPRRIVLQLLVAGRWHLRFGQGIQIVLRALPGLRINVAAIG